MKIAFIGFGSIGKRHFEIISKNFPSIKSILILNKRNVSKDNRSKFHYVVNKLEDVLKLNPTAALICSPSYTHLEYLDFFLRNNINILIEKPIYSKYDKEKFDNLLTKIKKKRNIIALVGYVLNYNTCLLKFFYKIKNNNLGKILKVQADCNSYLPNWRNTNYKKSVSAMKNGGGVLLELSHEIDYLLRLFGKFIYVKSRLYNSGDLDIKVEESADIFFENNKKISIYLNLNFNNKKLSRKCSVYFQKGVIIMDLLKEEILIFKKNSLIKKYKFKNSYKDMYINQINYFVNIIKSKKRNIKMINQSIEVMKIIDAIKKSNNLKKRVLI